MNAYLIPNQYIDFDNEGVSRKAAALSFGLRGDLSIAEACFKFVRDDIRHSWDHKRNPVTCRASEALRHRTGYCYSKSHLLAALLRANGIPAGLCYQRLSIDDSGPPYCLHGLNAVYLEDHGWYRCDARGNKPGVNARFTPPREALAFDIREPEEYDLPGIWVEPLSIVTKALERFSDVTEMHANLPDVPPWADRVPGVSIPSPPHSSETGDPPVHSVGSSAAKGTGLVLEPIAHEPDNGSASPPQAGQRLTNTPGERFSGCGRRKGRP